MDIQLANNIDISNLPAPDELEDKSSNVDISNLPHPDYLSGVPEDQGIIGKAEDFAKNLPMSAINLIPGMKEKAENVAAYRATPTYQQAPSDLPGITQGQRDKSFEESAEAQLSDPALAGMGMASETSLLNLAKLIPGFGQKIASIGPKMETGASRLATESVGLPPMKDIPKTYNPETGRSAKEYFGTKGIGTTALEEGALPLTGGMRQVASKSAQSIDSNMRQLDSLIPQVQEKLDTNLPEVMEKVGDLGTKLGNNLSDFRSSFPNISSKNAVLSKIDRTYLPQIQELANKDGDLIALNEAKKELYDQAKAISKNAYGPNANPAAQSELTFVQGLARTVKEQIEGLSNAADPTSGNKIKSLNQSISNMIDFQGAAEKQIGQTSSLTDIPSRILTGYTNKQFGTSVAARGMSNISKIIQTPAGTLAQRIQPVSQVIISPFTQQSIDKGPSDKATNLSTSLYNATDDSLKNVAENMRKDPSVSHYADPLIKAINDKDYQAKNNVLFLMLQNPNARKLLSPEEK